MRAASIARYSPARSFSLHPLCLDSIAAQRAAIARLVIASCLNPLAAAPAADRILIIRLGALGDVARTLPAVGALRMQYPGAQLAWLVEPAAAGLVEGHPWVDETLVFPRGELMEQLRRRRPDCFARLLFVFVRELRRRRFDLVIDFHAILKSAVIAWASGAPLRVSYARPAGREGSWLFANRRAELTRDKLSRFERNAALLRYLAIDPKACVGLPLSVDAEAAASLRLEVSPGDELVAIHPGTSATTPYKRYTAEGYGMLARELRSRRRSRCIVTFGPGPGERSLADAVVAASNGAAELAPPTEQLSELVALLSRCRLFVGSDSGPLHLAALVGTPVVQVLGPTDPVENAPYEGTASRSVRVSLACSPCRRGCSAATCMRIVPPERVASAALELLAAQASPPAHRRPLRLHTGSASPSGL